MLDGSGMAWSPQQGPPPGGDTAARTHACYIIREGGGGDQPASAFSPLVLQVAPVFWPPTELLCS